MHRLVIFAGGSLLAACILLSRACSTRTQNLPRGRAPEPARNPVPRPSQAPMVH
jgi:hypothetical protein